MNTNLIINTLGNKHNGTWFKIEWVSDLPLSAAAIKDGHIGYKETTAQCLKGVSYKNRKSVKNKIAHGYQLKSDLPWGHWKPGYEGLIVEHNNNDYIRLYFGPNAPRTKYYLDNKEVTFEDLRKSGLLKASFFNKRGEMPDCINVKAQNIQKIY